ncbi:MAG: methyltransferase family protein [Candidatus Helarchaeota archaeon]
MLFEISIWYLMVWIHAILFIVFGELIALTKYNIRLNISNKIFIILMLFTGLILPFYEQIRMIGAFDFYTPDHFQFFGIVYLILGLPIFVYSLINLFKIIQANIKATGGKNATPQVLLTNGYYGKVRHPMFGTLIMVGLSLMVAWGSIIGLGACLIVSLIFLYDANKEERTQLIPKFGEDYIKYRQKVPAIFFTRNSSVGVVVLLVLAIFGTVFLFI